MTTRTSAREPARIELLLGVAALAGLVVAALSPLGAQRQLTLTLLIGVAPGALLLGLARPHVALGAYLALLPLLPSTALAGGLNAGELLTAGILALLALTAYGRGHALRASLASLAPVLVPLALLTAVSVVSLLVNSIMSLGELVSALFKLFAFGMIPLLVRLHARDESNARAMVVGILLGGALVALYSVAEYALGGAYYEQYGYNRADGPFDTWNHLGGFMALVSMPTLGFALGSRGAARLGWTAAFLLEILALLLSLTLGALLAVVAAAALGGLFVFRVSLRRLVAAGLLFGAVFAATVIANPLLRDKLGRIDERIQDRMVTYAVGWQMFSDRALFGFGSQANLIEEFQLGTADYGSTALGQSSVIPHNSLILMAVEKGILGAIFFGLMIVGVLRILLRRRGAYARAGVRAGLYEGAVVGVIAFLLQNLSNNLLLHARLGIVALCLVVLVDRIGALRVWPDVTS